MLSLKGNTVHAVSMNVCLYKEKSILGIVFHEEGKPTCSWNEFLPFSLLLWQVGDRALGSLFIRVLALRLPQSPGRHRDFISRDNQGMSTLNMI